jgi:AbiV family abortive infection protein
MDVGATLLANATRLFEDSKTLYDKKRYPSAIALGIIGMEEYGKFLSHIGVVHKPSFEKRLHLRRQKDFAGHILTLSYLAAIRDHFGCQLTYIGNKTWSCDREKVDLVDPYVKFNYSRMDLSVSLKLLTSRPMMTAIRLAADVDSGKLHRQRNYALYVDVQDDKVVSNPDSLGKEQADTLIEFISHGWDTFRDVQVLGEKWSGNN